MLLAQASLSRLGRWAGGEPVKLKTCFAILVVGLNILLLLTLIFFGPTYLKAHDHAIKKACLALHDSISVADATQKAEVDLLKSMSERIQWHVSGLLWTTEFFLLLNSVAVLWHMRVASRSIRLC